MKFSLFSQDKKGEVVLLYDIGSASVGAALVLLEENMKPKILYSTRKNMVFQNELDFGRFTNSMEEIVKEVSLDVQKNGLPHLKFTKLGTLSPKKIYCTLASPWYASQTRIIKSAKEKPFTVTKEKIKLLVDKEVENFTEFAKSNKQINNEATEIIEKRIMQIKLNGYETSNPFNKKAETLELAIAVSVAQKKILNSITNVVHSVFVAQPIEFNSFSFTAFDSLRDTMIHTESFLFIDVSGEITDVSLIKDNIIRESSSFPMGKNNVIREVTKELNIGEAEAVSMISMYHDGTLQKDKEEKIAQILIGIEQKWISSFQNALLKLSDTFSIPSSVFFTSDQSVGHLFSSLIHKEEFSQFTMTDEMFSVIYVDHIFLKDFVVFSRKVERDPFLILGALFANKMYNI